MNFSARTVVKYNGTWFFVEHGKVNFSARTVVKYNGTWWFINGGKIDFASTTVVKYGNTWYYVKGGQVHWNDTGLCEYNGNWWYIKNGRIDFSARTLCKYNGTWWFVNNGKVDFYGETLCQYNGTWYYIEKGQVDFKGYSNVDYNGTDYYIKRGKIDWVATEREADARAKGYAKYAQEGTLPELYKIYYDNKGLPYFYSRPSDKYSSEYQAAEKTIWDYIGTKETKTTLAGAQVEETGASDYSLSGSGRFDMLYDVTYTQYKHDLSDLTDKERAELRGINFYWLGDNINH